MALRFQSRKIRDFNARKNSTFLPTRTLWWRFVRTFAYWILLISSLGIIIYGGKMLFQKAIFQDQEYALKNLELNPNDAIEKPEFLTLTGLNGSENVFQLSPETLREKLLRHPAIADAEVKASLPNLLKVTITARTPVAWLRPAPSAQEKQIRDLLVDEKRVIFPCTEQQWRHAQDLPVLYLPSVQTKSLSAGEISPNEDLTHALALLRAAQQIHHSSPPLIRSIAKPNAWSLELTTVDQTVATFSLRNQEKEFKKLELALAHAQRKGYQIATINLIPDRNIPITLHDSNNATPPPTPKPSKPVESEKPAVKISPKPPAKHSQNPALQQLLQQQETSADP